MKQTCASFAFVTLVLAVIAGCANYNFNDVAGTIYKGVTTVANSVKRECGNAQPGGPCVAGAVVTTQQRDEVQNALFEILTIHDLAVEARGAGDMDGAWRYIQQAQALLDALQRELVRRGVEVEA